MVQAGRALPRASTAAVRGGAQPRELRAVASGRGFVLVSWASCLPPCPRSHAACALLSESLYRDDLTRKIHVGASL
eukprot:1511638-Pyramimonas_sp.AAC.1